MFIFQEASFKGQEQGKVGRLVTIEKVFREKDIALKSLEKSMDYARLDKKQKEMVIGVFNALSKEKHMTSANALLYSKSLFDKESEVTDFMVSKKKSVLELYDNFGKKEWVSFLHLAANFVNDKEFGKSAERFDERHGNKDKPLESVCRYTATTLHTALKPVYIDGKRAYQAETLPKSDPFSRQFDMAKKEFGSRAEFILQEIQKKETGGVLN